MAARRTDVSIEIEICGGWPDSRLAVECLKGDSEAWSALVDRYKNLIYYIPRRYGLSTDAADDVFQSVCLALFSDLGRLRRIDSLPKWIIQTTLHGCFQHKRKQERLGATDPHDPILERGVQVLPEEVLKNFEQEQALRQAVLDLPARCQELVRMLFFEEPARPYREIARTLEIAPASVSSARHRCLENLRKRLVKVTSAPVNLKNNGQ